jgi:hypothetical protein
LAASFFCALRGRWCDSSGLHCNADALDADT